VNVPAFAVFLAVCREFFPEKLRELRVAFAGHPWLTNDPSFSLQLVRTAILQNSFELSRLPHSLIALFALSFRPGQLEFYRNVGVWDAEHFILHVLLDYVIAPTYVRGFVLSELSRSILSVEGENRREGIRAVVSRLAAHSEALEKVPDSRIELHDCKYFMNEFSEAQLFTLLEEASSAVPWDPSILDWALDDNRFKAIDTANSAILFKGRLALVVDDFTTLLILRGKFVDFLTGLVGRLRDVVTAEQFEKIFALFTTVFRYSAWRTGAQTSRAQCLSFLSTCAPPLHFFLCALAQLPLPDIPTVSGRSLLDRTLSIFAKIVTTGDFLSIGNLESMPASRWICGMAFCLHRMVIDSPTESLRMFRSLPVPRCALCAMLFSDFMAISRPVPRGWDALCDFDFLVRLAPEPSELSQPILRRLSDPSPSPAALVRLQVEWRAWIARFGIAEFVRRLLRLLGTHAKSQVDPDASEAAFRNAAALIVAASDCAGINREDYLAEVIGTVAGLVSGRVERPVCGRQLAEFCSFVLLSMREHQEEAFGKLIAIRHEIGESDTRSEELAFVVALIRVSIAIPKLLALMDDDIVRVLVMMRDVEAAAAFFSAKYPRPN
jgi:hypothetical protein